MNLIDNNKNNNMITYNMIAQKTDMIGHPLFLSTRKKK